MYQLVRPGPEWQAEYDRYITAWEATGQPFVPYAGGLRGMRYGEWLADLHRMEYAPEEGRVPATLYFFTQNKTILGMLDFRHTLNEHLLRQGGHIGYSLHPAHRGRGYAPHMLALGLAEARSFGLDRVLITCNKDNLASAATIRHCGGMLENEIIQEDGTPLQRYWVTL